jgi:hypothetical protein
MRGGTPIEVAGPGGSGEDDTPWSSTTSTDG